MGTITVRVSIWNYYRKEYKYGGHRRPAQQIIRAQGKSVVMVVTEITFDTTNLLLR
jgi:hypothetical protein